MSIFSELLPKINEISKAFTKNFNDELKAILDSFDKFEEDYHNGRNRTREKAIKDKTLMTTLQSITEDDDDPIKPPENNQPRRRSSNKNVTKQNVTDGNTNINIEDSNPERVKIVSKKRSKDEVDGMSSPEQPDKRSKRNASVKAQSIISKQVNMNLTQKMRRDDATDKPKNRRKNNEEDKENTEPSVIQIKQEKESLPPETMDAESLPLDINIKCEQNKDQITMPPPTAPVPKSRRTAKEVPKDKSDDNSEDEMSSGSKRSARSKKQSDMPPPASRATRASSRASSRKQQDEDPQPIEARPKRTRGRKKLSDATASSETINESSQPPIDSATASPAEKPRPKRTRKAQKAAEKPIEETQIEIKQERLTEPIVSSPVLTQSKTIFKPDAIKSKLQHSNTNDETNQLHSNNNHSSKTEVVKSKIQQIDATDSNNHIQGGMKHVANETQNIDSTVTLDETRVISKEKDLDKTVVLHNGQCNNEGALTKNVMNETVVIEKEKVMDATVVLDKDTKPSNITDDNSILTDDNDDEPRTPPKKDSPILPQPTSAVKEKVQQFEELASRTTRTKTRAMKKLEEQTENVTPPDKVNKAILDVDTLTKMNSLIFNGATSHGQISSSACKPRSNIPTPKTGPSSTSKLSSLSKHREAAEESVVRKEQDARKKKEAMLEAKRELQRRKREEKMAAAAAARLAAERERTLAALAAERERGEKLALLDQAKLERRRDLERKKQELARKVAETEERRRAEEQQRIQRLAEEQRRAELMRKKQIEEQDNMKKEAALMAKEIEVKQRLYIEKQKLKHHHESKGYTPLKSACRTSPVYMQDGFQFLNSDEDDEPAHRPPPAWAASKTRSAQLQLQARLGARLVDRLFSVRVHSPDLRELFPAIERARLKRTSSAVWRTPPHH